MKSSIAGYKLTRPEMKAIMAGSERGGFTCEWTNVSGHVTAGSCCGPSAQVCEDDAMPICAAESNCASVWCYYNCPR